MEQNDKVSWTTTYDTKNNLMVHSFICNIQVVTNLKTKEVKVFKDEHVIRNLDCDMTCKAYINFLRSVAEDANRLVSFIK